MSLTSSIPMSTQVRGRIVPPPPAIPPIKPPILQEEILIQSLVLPAPCGYNGSIVCDTFQYCPTPTAQASLLHTRSSILAIPSTKPAILCLHGGGQNRHTWRGTASVLARVLDAIVITVDLRGHGESFWADETSQKEQADFGESQYYHTIQFGADLDYLLQVGGVLRPNGGRIQPRRYVLLGASQGGLTSIFSDSVSNASGVILVDISPRVEPIGVKRIIGFMAPTSQRGFASVSEACDVIHKYTPHRSRPDELSVKRNLRQDKSTGRYYWRYDPMFILSRVGIDWSKLEGGKSSPGPIPMGSREQNRAMMRAFLDAVASSSQFCFDSAARIKCPCLLIRADSSDILSESGITEFRTYVPHAESIDVSNAHHMVMGDAADVFTNSIVGWLEKVLSKKKDSPTTNSGTSALISKL